MKSIKENSKKYVALLMVCAMIMGLFPMGVFAASSITIPATGITQTFDLVSGNVTINSDGIYVINQSVAGTTSNTITVNSNATIYLDGVNILVPRPTGTWDFSIVGGGWDFSTPNPINIAGNFTVNLYLVGGKTNAIASEEGQSVGGGVLRGSSKAGIKVPAGATLNIHGDTGVLNATGADGFNLDSSFAHGGGGAGIGGDGGYVSGIVIGTGGTLTTRHYTEPQSSGTVNIFGGVINTSGGQAAGYWGNGGTGIGGGGARYQGADGSSGTVTIHGGTVTVIGGSGGPKSGHAIGGDLNFNGGNLIAKSASSGSEIRSPLAIQPVILPNYYHWKLSAEDGYTLFSTAAYSFSTDQRFVEIAELTISNIEAPAPITTGSELSLTTPTVIGTPSLTNWQYSSNGSSDWTNFEPSDRPFTIIENGYYIRYYAISESNTTYYSNIRQITVNKYTPSISLSVSTASSNYPANVVLTTTLTGVDNLSGKTVKFFNGEAEIGEAITDTSGIATYTLNSPNVAVYSFRAEFNGDENNSPASSDPLSHNVSAKPIIVTPSLGQQKYYGQSDPALSYSTSGALSGETPLISGSLVRASGEGIANYLINLGTLVLSDNELFKASNYQLVLDEQQVNFEIKAYTTAAVATVTPNGENGWFDSGPITLSAPEGYLISTSNALIDNIWANEITLNADDGYNKATTYYLRSNSSTNEDAISTNKVFNYDVDKTAPTDLAASYDVINTGTLAQIGSSLTFGNFFKEGIKITISATDETSGLDKLHYTLKNSDGTTLVEEQNVSFNKEDNATITINFNDVKDYKDLTIEFYATDIAGNKTVVETLKGNNDSDNWTFENTNPVIGNFKISGNDITANQWFNDSSVTVNSAITDAAGIYKVSYKIDDAAEYTEITTGLGIAGVSATSYDFSQVVTGEGTHLVELLVTDNAMNTTTKTISFNIDSVKPAIQNVIADADYWQNTDVTLTVYAGDDGIGLAANAYSFDGGANWQSDNTKLYTENQTIAADNIMVKDAVGNIQSYPSVIYISTIDKANPLDPTVMLNNEQPITDWYTTYPAIEITEPIHVSDTAPETTYYKLWNTSAASDNTEPEFPVVLNRRLIKSFALNTQPAIDNDGVWMLKTWTEDEANNSSTPNTITINVDTTAPDGDISIEENSVKTFINTITFGLFFNQNIDVSITATDDTSGVATIEYYKSTSELDEKELNGIDSWVEYTGVFNETVVDASKFIYYVKITNNAGNVTYLSSNGITFDTTLPEITGITNEAVYYVDQAVTVTDINLDSITLNGNAFESGQKLVGNVEETNVLTATDKAGNITTYTVTMLTIASLTTEIDSLSIDNVKSSDKETIEAVAANVEAVLLTTANGASQTQIDELNAILDLCNNLLNSNVLLLDAPTGTKVEGVNGTTFELGTELVVTSIRNTLDTSTMRKFALGVGSAAQGQQIAQLYDIKFMQDGQAVQPDGMVKITLTLTDEQANYTNLQIAYIADDGTTTIIPSTINGREISFIIDHFSYYAIIGTPIEAGDTDTDADPDPNQITKTGENPPVFPFRALSLLSAALLLAVIMKRKYGTDEM